MALRAMIAREIPGVVISTTEALVKYGVFMVSIAVAYAIPSEASELCARRISLFDVAEFARRNWARRGEEGTYSADAAWVLLLLRDELNAIALLPNHFFCIASRTSAPTPGE